LNHHLEGEGKRLALMSELLDPMQRRYIESLNIGPGARTLEVGCGNGSISAWLAQRRSSRGVRSGSVPRRRAQLVLRQGDIVAGPADPGTFDLVTARAIVELRGDLVSSGELTDALVDACLGYCADPNWWTQTIAFTAVHARARRA
jgi:hypothetical protein